MTGRGKTGKAVMTCKVDNQLLDSLSKNLKALREEVGEEDGAVGDGGLPSTSHGDTVDSSDLNSILQHILYAVNELTESVREIKRKSQAPDEPTTTKVNVLEERVRENEDGTDECCQRSMKGNFVILSKANINNNKVSLIKTDGQLVEDEETLVQHVIDIAERKYGVKMGVDDIQACHRLPNGAIVLRLIRRGPGSAWAGIAEKIKEGFNADMNIYFNFQLTRRRNNLLFELRQLRRNGKIHKFYTDENGQISVKMRKDSPKTRLTFITKERSKAPRTVTLEELKSFVD